MFKIYTMIFLLVCTISSCGFPDYVYEGPVITGEEVTAGIQRAEAISGEEFKRELTVGTEVSTHCPEWAMACVATPNIIMVSEGYPIAAQVCHEVLHIIALDHHDVWDSYHHLYDYGACNV